MKSFLVKYCNFVPNLGCSLGEWYDGRSYVDLGFFSLEGNPWFIWGNCISILRYYSKRERERGGCVREKSKLQGIYCRLYLFILLDNINGKTGCLSMDVAQIGWTTYTYVSLVLCVSIFLFPKYCMCFISLLFNF